MSDKSEPAFPSQLIGEGFQPVYYIGLTKREHFAGLAMQGQIAKLGMPATRTMCLKFAADAYEIADAMLTEGAK